MWENLEIYYSNFMFWMLNDKEGVDLFYKKYRWDNRQKELKNIDINKGISFYPFAFTKEFNIKTVNKRVVNFDEIVLKNFEMLG